MRRILSVLAALTFVAAVVAPAFAADTTIKGELVDQACFISKKEAGKGEAHKDCAVTCAKKGQAVALATADGKLYTVTGDLAANNNEKLVAHMTHTVELTGEVTEKDGKMSIAAKSLKMAAK
jgi:hypothetical protein